MGGEGSAMAATTSLKNNRSMLNKRAGKSVLKGSYAYTQIKKFPKATESQILAIQRKIQLENKLLIRKQIFVFVVLIIVILIGYNYL
ncbi:hypothetical protein J1D01_04750 [Seonamhaeicola sp. NFXS20]|uniref:hypothetical protein n=1 Tax=Seonamhaeicola sp. NFXS20 TaxID=2816959 RepID=UPI003B8BD66A